MSEARVIACNNCGSRYKLPPTFQGSKVRCKNCGAVIEIESSIVAPASPAAKAPAARPKSRPAEPTKKPVARASSRRQKSDDEAPSSRRSSSSRRGSKVSGSRSRRGDRAAEDEDEDEAEPRSGRGAGRRGSRGGSRGSSRGGRGRRGEGEVEEKSKTPMILGIGGGVVVLAVALFFLLGNNGDKPADAGQGNQVAGANDNAGKADTNKTDLGLPPEEDTNAKDDKVAKDDKAAEDKTGKAEAAAGKDGGKAEEATAKKDPEKEPEKVAKKPHAKPKAGESSTPFDPKTETEELVWAKDVTDEEKKEITEMVETAFSDDSIQGMRAGRKLQTMGRKAFPAIVNRLRTVDYMNEKQHTGAYSLHKTLEKITLGRNVGYNPTIPVTQGAAWWNARTVKGWMRFWTQQVGEGDQTAWDEFIALRKKKQKAEGEDEDF